ncbi:MAG: hypothetical protein WA138_08735 [Parvibaculum sp.]
MQLNEIVNEVIALGHQGFGTVDSLQGIIIAVIAAALMSRYGQIVFYAVAATIIHEVVNVGRGMMGGGSITIPDFTNMEVLKLIAVRFVGYLIVISLVYLVRRIVMRS